MATIDFTTALKRKVSSINLKPLVKAGIVVAAVILIGFALLLNTPTAKAITIEQIYEAIENVKNVYISSFVPGKAEPVQERWVSRTLNVYMNKTGKELVLWDIPNGTKRIRHADTDVTETTPLTDDSFAAVERKMSGSLGLMPFYDISETPENAKWSQVPNEAEAFEAIAKDTEVYDLTWGKYNDSVLFKWRVFVDTTTKLPQRTKFYRKLSADDDYILRSTMVVKYLDDGQMQAVIKGFSF